MTTKNSLHAVLTWLCFYLPNVSGYRSLEEFSTVLHTELQKTKYRNLLGEEVSPKAIRKVFKDLGKKMVVITDDKNGFKIEISKEFHALAGVAVSQANPTEINRIKEVSKVVFRSSVYSYDVVVKQTVKESDKVLELMQNLNKDRIDEARDALKRLYGILKENQL